MNLPTIFKNIQATSKKTKIDVYAVGGFVRDLVLSKEEKINLDAFQTKDIDFVVVGSGIAFAEAFDNYMKQIGSLVLFEDFDTARYVFEDGMEIEFAGARSEIYKKESRKPEVTKAPLEEDLSRRDFTVNALAAPIDIFTKKSITQKKLLDTIIDPFNGLSDIEHKIIKTPRDPDETFFDDPLRMLRAARFAAQLGFIIEDKTLESIKKQVKRLEIVSMERIRDEFFKLLAAPVPSQGLWILYNTKLIDEFIPEVSDLEGVEDVYGHLHKNNLSHTFKVVDNIATRTDKPLLRFAALMHDIGKPGTKKFDKKRGWTFDGHEHLGKKMTRDIGKRIRMKRSDIEYVAKLVRWHQQPIGLMDSTITDSAVRRLIVNLEDDLEDLLKLGRSDITTGNPNKKERRLKNYDNLETRIAEVLEKDQLRAFQSPVRGGEIIKLTNLKPGPTVGNIKKAIEEAILDGIIPNEYDAALAYFNTIKDACIRKAAEWEKKP